MTDITSTLAVTAPRTTGAMLLALTVLIAVLAWYLPNGADYVVVLGLVVIFLLLTGKALTGRLLGILINERNLMSLSRLQLVIWTALIVSGFFVIAMLRIKTPDVDHPLAIGVDWQIWTLLGMSAASFVGTPLLYGDKAAADPKDAEKIEAKTAAHFKGETKDAVAENRRGVLYANSSVDDARFSDMFQGDELVNTHLVDVAKLQMFFFTIAIAIAYGVQLYELIAYGDLGQSNVRLPELQNGLLALMGVSHAGYLGSKSVTRTPTST